MEDIKRIINVELDPEFYERKREEKQQKGFIPEGKKILEILSFNEIAVHDITSGADYLMSSISLFNIIDVMGFPLKKIELAKSKLYANQSLVIDFDLKKFIIYNKEEKKNVIGEMLSAGKEEFNNLDLEL